MTELFAARCREKTVVGHIPNQWQETADGPEGAELPPQAELFAQLASRATEALLLSHRAVQIAEAKLAARATAACGDAARAESTPASSVPVPPRRRLRERFGLPA